MNYLFMKKLFIALAVIFFSIVHNSYAKNPNDPNVKVIATFANLPPFSFKGDDGSVKGFGVDLIKAIAKEQGFKVQVIAYTFDQMANGLEEGVIDMIVSGLLKTEKRQQKYNLSNSYATAHDALMYINPNLNIHSDEDVKNLKIAALANSAQLKELINVVGVPPQNIVPVKTLYLGYKALMTHKVDAVATYNVALHALVKGKKGDFKYYILKSIPPRDIVAMSQKNNSEMIAQFNAGLEKIKSNGTYQKIVDQWLK